MSKVGVIAVAVAAPGRADAVADRLKRAVTAMHAESGTEIYSVHRDAKDERTFWFFELYTDRAAMVEHARGDALRLRRQSDLHRVDGRCVGIGARHDRRYARVREPDHAVHAAVHIDVHEAGACERIAQLFVLEAPVEVR